MADLQHPIAKANLQMVLKRLLDGISEDDLEKIQSQSDDLEANILAEGHHDHDHPTLA